MTAFFPDISFGWVFLGTLLALLAAASFMDLRFMKIPKWITFTALPLGIVFNIFRLGLLASHEQATWLFSTTNPWLGAVDGLLFSLAGFALGFGVFTVMWVLGICGGGDVKLFAAIGAWVGPFLTFSILIVTIVLLAAYLLGYMFVTIVTGKFKVMRAKQNMARLNRSPSRRLVTHALTMTLATVVVLTWSLRHEMGFERSASVAGNQGGSHAN